MKTYGYARISPLEPEHELAAQQARLSAAGCDRIFSDYALPQDLAGRSAWRALQAALAAGDRILIVKMDRAAASFQDLADLATRCERGSVAIHLAGSAGAPAAATLALTPALLREVAGFERDMLLERKRCAMAAGVHIQR